MDKYKHRFTGLQQDILNLLFIYPTYSFNGRALARKLKVSPTAVLKAIKLLTKEKLLAVEKHVTLSIKLNRDNEHIFELKRIANLKNIYESGLAFFLSERFPGATIIVFGSYAYGEDVESSDIDIAVIAANGDKLGYNSLSIFEKHEHLERAINIQYFKNFKSIEKNLKENIINGIVLKGAIEL